MSCHSVEKIKKYVEVADYTADCENLSKMELRQRYSAESNTHRNMLARQRTNGAVIHPDFRSFADFLRCVGPMPAKGATLDRIDNSDPEYGPGKVRWADRRTQNNNKSDTLIFHYSRTGDTYTVSRLAKLQNVAPSTIRKRLERGWCDDEIIEGKRTTQTAQSLLTKQAAALTSSTSKFPEGLYNAVQLAALNRSERHLSHIAAIYFHRKAHYHQSYREEHNEEYMLPTYEELMEFLEFASVTRGNHKRHFLKWWPDARPHVVYSNLRPDQKAMVAEYDPEWTALQEAKEKNRAEIDTI